MSLKFNDRIVEFPHRYTMTDNGDGTITLTPSPGNIVQEGTPLNAVNMNIFKEEATRITDTVTQAKYQWGIESGVVFLEKVVE